MILKAKLEDKEEVLAIYNDARAFIKTYNSPQWQDGFPNEESFLSDLESLSLYVNKIGNTIVSVASIFNYESTYEIIDGAWQNDENYAVIHRIATRRDARGKGYSKAILDYIHNELGFMNIRIDTHELNIPMLNFLNKNGFVFCGIIYLNKPDDNKRLAYQKVYK